MPQRGVKIPRNRVVFEYHPAICQVLLLRQTNLPQTSFASPEYDGIISAIYHRDEDISNASRQLSVAKTAQKRAAPHMTAHPPAASPPGAPTFSSPFQSDFCQISQISVKPQSNFAPAPAADGAPDAPARRQRHDKLRAKMPSLTISIWVTWALAFCCSTWPKNLASKIRQKL